MSVEKRIDGKIYHSPEMLVWGYFRKKTTATKELARVRKRGIIRAKIVSSDKPARGKYMIVVYY